MPLVAHDPYFSIWSPADRLTDAATVHWTGRAHPLTSLIRIDGEAARLMGAAPANIAALPQTSVTVRPTHTIYTFANAHVRATLTFMTPSLPSDLDVLSRPVTYISWDVASVDGRTHRVQIYFDCGDRERANENPTPSQKLAGNLTVRFTKWLTQQLGLRRQAWSFGNRFDQFVHIECEIFRIEKHLVDICLERRRH